MQANPNPERISGPLWTLVNRLTDLTGTAFVDEFGGIWVQQKGSHSDAEWLKKNHPDDYSLRGELNWNGPQRYGRAFDWTFPSAQRGDWSEIGIYSNRIAAAWKNFDPRTYPLFEVLCQTPEDKQPEGYVFYPERKFRVPDESHEWHIHGGILTAYVNDAAAMDAIYSIFAGEPLYRWQDRIEGEDMGRIWFVRLIGGDGTYWRTSDLVTRTPVVAKGTLDGAVWQAQQNGMTVIGPVDVDNLDSFGEPYVRPAGKGDEK